uniref:Uncharacterized protein n=1 Tax=Amphimedon queenslandica TaxID=400682 RepID=A0A1X7SNP1_AMPQE
MRLRVQILLWAEVFLILYIFFRDANTILGNRRPGFYLWKYSTYFSLFVTSLSVIIMVLIEVTDQP